MRVFSSPTTSVLYFLHSDHLGSTSLTTDASGNVVARQLYDAWGNIRSGGVGSMPTDIGYTGQRLDSTGLMYYRARYYAQGLGRFISADTMVPDEKNPQQFNRYAYVNNRPLNLIDPNGHCSQDRDRDSECWDEYASIVKKLGFVPTGLSGWMKSQLTQLDGWLNRGVSFVTQVADNWAANEISTVVSTLEMVQNKLSKGIGIDKLLGLKGAGGPGLEFRRSTGNFGNGGPDNYIEIKDINPATLAHEMGHVVDWRARPTGSASGYSETGYWLDASGWSDERGGWYIGDGVYGAPTEYAYKGRAPGEDFAESFAWAMTSGMGMARDNPFNPGGRPNVARLYALNVALGLP